MYNDRHNQGRGLIGRWFGRDRNDEQRRGDRGSGGRFDRDDYERRNYQTEGHFGDDDDYYSGDTGYARDRDDWGSGLSSENRSLRSRSSSQWGQGSRSGSQRWTDDDEDDYSDQSWGGGAQGPSGRSRWYESSGEGFEGRGYRQGGRFSTGGGGSGVGSSSWNDDDDNEGGIYEARQRENDDQDDDFDDNNRSSRNQNW